MNRDRQLLLFIQGSSTDVYVNILTHCINNESVQDIYFAINEGATDAKEQIRRIRERFESLLEEPDAHSSDSIELRRFQPEYRKAYDKVPTLYQAENRIIKVVFSKPELSINRIKKNFPNSRNLLVDITGCSKKVSTDVVASYLSSGVEHVRYFELDKEVYQERWQNRMYHNVRKDLPYYEYIDFSEPGTTTIESFNRMRSQGYLIKLLFIIILLLGSLVAFLISKQQNILAQYVSLLLSIITGIGLLLGLLNDTVGTVSIIKGK